MTSQRVRIRSVPLGPALVTGAWAGFVPGLFIGALAGVLLSVGAGAMLEWIRELSFTTGVQAYLLPFGDRIGVLETLQDNWYFVIPAAAIAMGLFAAVIGLLTAAVVSASYGSLFEGVELILDSAGEAPARPERRRRPPRRRTNSAA